MFICCCLGAGNSSSSSNTAFFLRPRHRRIGIKSSYICLVYRLRAWHEVCLASTYVGSLSLPNKSVPQTRTYAESWFAREELNFENDGGNRNDYDVDVAADYDDEDVGQ